MATIQPLREDSERLELLLIEDNPGDARLVKEAILESQCAFELATVPKLSDGIVYLAQHKVHVILLDLNLPDSLGVDTFRKLRKAYPDIPIVVLSGIGTEELAVETVREGAQDYLFKDSLQNFSLVVRTIRHSFGRNQMERQLIEARNEAEKVAKFKTEFLANMSHEIRTPLNGVIGMTSLLLETRLSPEQREYVDTIRSSGEVLLALINDILDLSKIEEGKIELETTEFELRSIVEETMELFAASVRAKPVLLTNIIHPDVPVTVHGDRWRLRQILSNLLSNAVKFTEQGEVILRVNKVPAPSNSSMIRFEVVDTGIGITKTGSEKLFQAFSQSDSSTTRKFGGTGLGLAISKRLVEIMGGEIGVTSSPGHGSQFWFTVPFKTHGSASHPNFTTIPLKNKSVLIATECKYTAHRLGEQLSLAGMHVTVVKSAETLLRCLKESFEKYEPFDVLAVDLRVNPLEATAFFEPLKLQTQRLPPVLFLTPGGHTPEIQWAHTTSAMRKPIRQSELYRRILELLNRRPLTAPISSIERKTRTAGRVPSPGSNRHSILIVEDNMVNQKIVSRMLEKLGFQSTIASSGDEALAMCVKTQFAAILMDCQMPGMDGFQTTETLRKTATGASLPIIAMTAHALKGDRERCLASGMNDYLSKPMQLHQLRDVLARWVQEEPSEPLDWDLIESWRNLSTGSDNDFLNEVISLYLENTPHILSDMRQALRFHEPRLMSELAHKLKGSSSTLGAISVARLCESIEREAPNTQACTELLTRLEKEFELAKDALRQLTVKSLATQRC